MTIHRTIAVSLITLAATASIGATQPGAGYSQRSLKGTYGLSGAGTLGFGTLPAAVVGLNSFDRNGGCDLSVKVNAGGGVTSLTTAQCHYTVIADGTGTIDVT